MRMMRLVRFRERTSLLVEALETTSRAVSSRGALSAAVRARRGKYFIIFYSIKILTKSQISRLKHWKFLHKKLTV